MSCPTEEQLAAAAAGEAERTYEHSLTCGECRMLLAQQTEIRELGRQLEVPRLSPLRRAKLALAYDPVTEIQTLAQQLPVPTLDPDRRARLAAETLARADAVTPRPWFMYAGIATGLAAAAALAFALFPSTKTDTGVAISWPDQAWVKARTPVVAPAVVPDEAPAPEIAVAPVRPVRAVRVEPNQSFVSASVTGSASFTRNTIASTDTVQLRDGVISIDSRDRAPVAVAIGDTTIQVKNARVEIRAAHGVIVSAHAFAGSIERTSPESSAMISAGEVWTPPPAEASLAAFRSGWKLLHASRNAEALAAFERASDPVVAEESAFWAAVACQRSGDPVGAAQRFQAFLDAYPQSTRSDAARAALAKL